MFRYRADIDGLRAVAILPVLLFHAGLPGFSGGFVGVDVFFVISSFLITSIISGEIARGDFSLVTFYERRARRILPALTAMMLACFAVGALVLMPSELDALGKSAFATTFFAANFHFAASLGYFAPAADFSPLLHTWSLAVEEQFYLFFPLLLLLLYRLGGWRTTFRALFLLSAASFALSVAALSHRPNWSFYLLPFRAWELGLGACLALLPASRNMPGRMADALALAGLAAILLPVVLYGDHTAFPGVAALPPVLGAIAIIHAGRSGGTLVTRLLSTKPMIWFGLISYSLYLWHWPIFAFLRSARGVVELPLSLSLLGIVLSVLLSALSYRWVEKPFRRRPPEGPGRQRIFTLSAMSLCLTAGFGAFFALIDGAPGRLSEKALAAAAAAQDTNPLRKACFGKTPEQGLCALGADPDADGTDFLLWGDSHALALMPAIDLAAKANGLSGLFAGHSACLPVPGLTRLPEDPRCSEINRSVLSHLESRQDVPLVILAGRWTLAVEGHFPGEEAGTRVILAAAHAVEAPGGDNAALVEATLSNTLSTLTGSGRKVLVLGSIPEPGWNVPLRMAKAEMPLGRSVPAPQSRADLEARSARTETLLEEMAQASDAVTYAALHRYFCEEFCAISDSKDVPLYSDEDHLTVRAATQLLAPAFTELLHATHH